MPFIGEKLNLKMVLFANYKKASYLPEEPVQDTNNFFYFANQKKASHFAMSTFFCLPMIISPLPPPKSSVFQSTTHITTIMYDIAYIYF